MRFSFQEIIAWDITCSSAASDLRSTDERPTFVVFMTRLIFSWTAPERLIGTPALPRRCVKKRAKRARSIRKEFEEEGDHRHG
jgi:hypothetical protein